MVAKRAIETPSTSAFRTLALFWASILGLVSLPLVPEAILWLRRYDDLRAFASIAYYAWIASSILVAPALFLPPRLARFWLLLYSAVVGVCTIAVAFQAVSVGTRWDSTTHAALMETTTPEAWAFIRTFASPAIVVSLAAIAFSFVACVWISARSTPPLRGHALAWLGATLLVGSYGIRNVVKYGRNPIHSTRVSDTVSLPLVEASRIAYHPLLRMLATHWNYRAAREYRHEMMREIAGSASTLKGATVVPGATPPRVILLVIGESANRRHWSLYGYSRPTTPELARKADELVVYRDTICRSVGTLTEIQGMLCARLSLPVFGLFSAAGYRTHWLSAQFDQGPNDVTLAAISQTCDRRTFLNGAYDENLVGHVRTAVSEPGNHLIVVHLFGSHIRYDDRYPVSFRLFTGTDERSRRLAAYDNSIRYTDHVLDQLISVLRERAEPGCFVYLSDHSEDVYDTNPNEYLFRSDSIAADAMYEIPLVMWFSPEYRRANPHTVEHAYAHRSMPVQSLEFYHTLVDLARLSHPLLDPRRSIVSADYEPRVRHVGAMSRIYQGKPAPDVPPVSNTHPIGSLHP